MEGLGMNIAAWVAQDVLAAFYLVVGSMKAFTTMAQKQLSWAKERPKGFVRFVGTAEILGALGIVLPLLTGILPWLTVPAALGLAVVQVLAIGMIHLPRKEYGALPFNILLMALAVFVVIARWNLFG
jgi:putative oxidoreductase